MSWIPIETTFQSVVAGCLNNLLNNQKSQSPKNLYIWLHLSGKKNCPTRQKQTKKFPPENGIIIIVFVYDFSDDNILKAVQERSN